MLFSFAFAQCLVVVTLLQPSHPCYVFISTHGYDGNLHLSCCAPSLAVSEETIPRGNGSQGHHTNLTGASEVVAHALQGTALASPSLPALQRRVDALIAQSEGFLKTTRAVTEACRTQVSVENTTRLEYAHNDFFDVPFAPRVARFGVDKSTPHATSSMGHAGSGAGGVGDVRAAGSGGGGGEEEKEDDDILARWRRRRMQSEAVAEVAKARTVTTASHSGAPAQPHSRTAIALALLNVLLWAFLTIFLYLAPWPDVLEFLSCLSMNVSSSHVPFRPFLHPSRLPFIWPCRCTRPCCEPNCRSQSSCTRTTPSGV